MLKRMGMVMKSIINLGDIPLVNNLTNTQQDSFDCKRYPLEIFELDNLIMKLGVDIKSEKMFSNYLYRSSVNAPYVKHCEKMWDDVKKFDPKNIADIGGNDGALLNSFRRLSDYKLNLTNIDASESFKEDNEKAGIAYYNEYWGERTFENKFDLITSTNVFQHNPFYEKFVEGIVKNLDGRWLLEFPYFLETVKTNQFDQIYHEHVYYWLVYPLHIIFKKYGLKIIDISEKDIHGGTLRLIMSNKDEDEEDLFKINHYIKAEREYDFSIWGKKIIKKISEDKIFLNQIQGSIACFGAAAKGCIYLNSIDINNKFKYVVDDTKDKQGKYVPGTGLKVVPRDFLKQDSPKYILILAHNFKDFIIQSLKEYGYKGKFIVMFPCIKVID
jgi:hypothetical protein